MPLLALLACVNPSDVDSAVDSAADSAAPVGARCPAGMVAVGEPTAPSFCIDAYEGVYEGDLGSADQTSPDAVPPDATARSAEPGELPALALSFDQAKALCASTPVLDADGEALGFKRLVRSQEWEDAGDGQLGEGGLRFPYGDTWDGDACVTFDGTWSEPQPAGTLESCVSPFGVYDLIGNLWEWADPQQALDVGLSLLQAETLGLTLVEDDQLSLGEDLSGQVRLDVAGVDPLTLSREADGRLFVTEVQPESWGWALNPATGYLVLDALQAETEAERWLAVVVEPLGEVPGPASIRVNWEDDGTPLTDKRGCAHYAGTEGGCALSASYYGHVHDFDGSIGFRCAADPY